MKSLGILLLSTLLCYSVQAQKVGVVLSGGGAAGSAHVGVLKALEENEIPIDYIVGTSVGALIGAFYASGYSPAQIEELISSSEFRNAANGIIEENDLYYIMRSDDNSSMLSLNFNIDSILGTNLPTNFVSSVAIDYGLMELFSPANAAANGNFDSLMVPYRALAANISEQKQTILKEGNLSTAVRASMTYPFYISPISIDGKIMFDGGLYNNFPVDIMCNEFYPDFIIASNVATENIGLTEDNLIAQLRSILTKEANFNINCSIGIILNTDVGDISTFDFYGTELALQRGYETTQLYLDSIKSMIPSRRTIDEIQYKRTNFRTSVPTLLFDSVEISGNLQSQARYFKRSLQLNEGKNISSAKLKPAYYKLTSNDKIKSAYPTATYNKARKAFRLSLAIKEEKKFRASFGGVISTKPFSTGFFQLEHNLLRSTELKSSGNIYFGNFYNSAQFKLRWDIPFDIPFYVESQFTANQYDYFNGRATFIDDINPPYIINSERFIETKVGLPVFTNGKILIGYNYLWQEYEYYQSNDFVRGDTTDRTSFEGFRSFIGYERNSLNRKQYANKGSQWRLRFGGTSGWEDTEPGSTAPIKSNLTEERKWISMNFMMDKYFFSKRKFHLGTYLEVNYSDLPNFQNYTVSTLISPAFEPLPENRTIFQSQYRARTFFSGGIKAIYSLRDLIDFRVELYLYQPYEELLRNDDGTARFGKEAISRNAIGTFTAVYHSRLGPLAASLNYYDGAQEELSFLVHFGYILFNKRGLE